MPKSRFNAVREKARATRHNPLEGRKTETGTASTSSLPSSSSTIVSPQQEDAIPILKSLPLAHGKGTTAPDSSEILWALTSLTSLLSEKSSRVQLLAPQHQLVARVLLQLDSERDIQIKDAASGCLRNLCIEAGSRARKSLEDGSSIEKIIAEIHSTAGQLALTEGSGGGAEEGEVWRKHVEEERESKKQLLNALLQKPKDQLNKKEKRQLAKLEAAAGKSSSAGHGADDQEMNEASTQSSGVAASVGSKDDEKTLLTYSHLTNLISILWCLVEVSQSVANHCSRIAPSLCKIFTAVVLTAVESVKALSEQASSSSSTTEGESNGASTRIDIAKKDRVQTYKAVVQLATTCLNALVTFTDTDQEFAAAVLGFSRQDLHLARKGPAKSFILGGEDEAASSSRSDGVRNVATLLSTVAACKQLPRTAEEGSADRILQRQSETLALLSTAVIRNIQGCLPASLKDKVNVVRQGVVDSVDSSAQNLSEVEMTVSLPFLIQVLEGATGKEAGKLLSGLQTDAHLQNGDHEMSQKERGAEEELNNLSLALEILAELVADPQGWSQETRRQRNNDTIEVDDEEDDEEDEEMNEGESEDSQVESDGEVPLEDDVAMEMDSGKFSFGQSRIATFFSPQQIETLLMLGVEKQMGFAGLHNQSNTLDGNMASSLRSVSIRALSVLNNQLLALASYALPPPSQPSKQDDERLKSFHRWITAFQTAGASGAELGKIWRRVFEHASRVASLPSIGNFDDANKEGRDARKVMEICLCIMWSLSRCYEGVGGKDASKALAVDASHFSGDDFCQVSQQGVGVVASLIAAYKSSKRASGNSAMQAPTDADGAALQLAPTPDGIRIHSLGVLSTLVRQSFITIDVKEQIISLIADTLEVLPSQPDLTSRLNGAGLQDSTSVDAMVIAINGIIDTFADETRDWDSLYAKVRLQARLKRASVEVKTAARTIDKRRQPALRASADEAWSNLIAFVEYRAGLM